MLFYRHAIFLLWCFSFPLSASQINFLVHPISPFIENKNNQLSGLAIELVDELVKRNNAINNYTVMPFPRALKAVQQRDNFALFIVARTKVREGTVKWVGPLITSCVYLYKHRDNPIEVKSLADIKGKYSISVGRGNADHEYLSQQNFTKLYPVDQQFQSLLMLNARRVDFTPMSELVMTEMLKMTNVNADNIENTNIKLYDSELYLAFSKNVSDDVTHKWQQALDKFKQTPQFYQIIDKYLHK